MEPATGVMDETTSLVSYPTAGIRAVLSRDDSDGENFVLSDSASSSETKNKGFTSSSYSSFSSDGDNEEEEGGGFVGGNGVLGNAELGEALAKPRALVPIAKLSAYEDEDDDDQELVISEEEDEDERFASGGRSFSAKNIPLKVRSFADEDLEFEEEEPFQTAVAGSASPEGENFNDLLEDVEERLEYGLDDEGGVDESKIPALQGSQMNSIVDEATKLTKSEDVDGNVVKFTSDGDTVVGELMESKDLEVEAVETSVVEDSAFCDLEAVGVTDVKVTNEDADDTGVSGIKEVETSVDEESASANTEVVVTDDLKGVAGIDGETEGVQDLEARSSDAYASEKPELAKSGISEIDGVKFTSQGDSVVDKINVDAVEAVETGEFVTGEHDALKCLEEANQQGFAVYESARAELGSCKHDPDLVDRVTDQAEISGSVAHLVGIGTVVEPEAFEGLMSNVDGRNGVNFTSGGDTIVGEMVESKDLDVEAVDTSVVEESTIGDLEAVEVSDVKVTNEDADHTGLSDLKGVGGIDGETEGVQDWWMRSADAYAPEKPDLAKSDISEIDGVKFTSRGDSVLEKINVDVIEAMQAVIGEHDSLKCLEEAKENGSAVDETVRTELGSWKHGTDLVDAVADQAEISGSVDHHVGLNTAVELEATFEGMMSYADELLGSEKEKVKQGHTADDAYQTNDGDKPEMDEESIEGSTDGEMDGLVFGGSATARQFMQEMEESSEQTDGQIVTDTEEEADSDNEQYGNELFDSTAFAVLLKAATNVSIDSDNLTVTAQEGTRLFSVDRPAGLGPSFHSARISARPNYPAVHTSPGVPAVSEEKLTEEERNKLEKLQQLRVKFIRLIYRLGHSVEDSFAAHVLYRLALVAGRRSVPSFSLEVAKQTALKLEEEGKDDLDFSLNILVLGKSGVGKSATINSIFGEEKVRIKAFEPGTSAVNEITGVVSGVNIRLIDTPGLRTSAFEQGFNHKVLSSVKKLTKKFHPDIVLYVDRLDSQTKDLNDLPLLRTITNSLGSSIWRNTIVALTHAGCAPPDGPSGSPLSYEVFVAQRSHIVQQYIGQAVGDFRLMGPGLMNPVSLVENHQACRVNREGQKVLPNGQAWKPQLMLLCFSTKILSEASSVTKAQDSVDQRKLFGFRVRSIPLPYLLSSLLQSRSYPKLTSDQGVDDVDSDIDLEDYSDLELEEEEDEYDQLPPFKPLRKSQIAKLSKDQKKAYLEEFDYRVKLLQKKQWKNELKRMKEKKKKKKGAAYKADDYDQVNEAPNAVPVPLPDFPLPQTFDGDNPAYRYRLLDLEPTSQLMTRPVLETHGWDHDCGYDGVNVEHSLGIAGRFPAAVSVQMMKDKKEFNLQLDSCVSAKHGENGSSLVGFDIQNIGKQMGYIIRGETKYKNLKKNKMAAGASVTFLGETVATGLKLEDQISVGKRLVFVGSTGAVRSDKDSAYGANLEVRLRDVDYPIGQDQSSILLSLMKGKGDFYLGANLLSQVSIGRNSKMGFRVALNNRMSGQITVRTSSSDHLQLALVGLIPIAVSIFRRIRPGVSEDYGIY